MTISGEQERLAACPFCGGTELEFVFAGGDGTLVIQCECGVSLGNAVEDSACADEETPSAREMLAAAWNTRVSLPPQGGEQVIAATSDHPAVRKARNSWPSASLRESRLAEHRAR